MFSGLDPSYVYNVRLYWLIDESLANFDAGATNGDTTEIHNNINHSGIRRILTRPAIDF